VARHGHVVRAGREGHAALRGDGEEALRLASPIAPLESRPFDIILMDLKMPGLDGYEATRRLRKLEPVAGRRPPLSP
jgi:CheY-like chemotaxis protein